MLFYCISEPSPEQIPNKTINFMTKSQRTSLICSSAKQVLLPWWTRQIQQIFRSIEFLQVKVKGESEYCWITPNPKWAGVRVWKWLWQDCLLEHVPGRGRHCRWACCTFSLGKGVWCVRIVSLFVKPPFLLWRYRIVLSSILRVSSSRWISVCCF